MSKTETTDVIVHKDINLQTGETLGEFTGALGGAAKEHIKQKLNLPGPTPGKSYPGWSCYVSEIFSKNLVVAVYKDAVPGTSYYAFSYARDNKTNKFTFGDTTEVERFTGFRAKPTLATTTKRAEAADDSAFVRRDNPEPSEAEVVKSDGGEVDVQKAPKTAASTNNLPDAAFAVISAGGKKDASGKTVPRSLRHLPHHTAAVKSPTENSSVDIPHLRNALARVGQSNLSPADMAKAKAHLEAHAKAVLVSRGGKPSVAKSTDSNALIADVDRLIERASVAKSADGALWVRKGADFWASLV